MKRERVTRKEKVAISKAIEGLVGKITEGKKLMIKTDNKTYWIKIMDGKVILPSGRAMEIRQEFIV